MNNKGCLLLIPLIGKIKRKFCESPKWAKLGRLAAAGLCFTEVCYVSLFLPCNLRGHLADRYQILPRVQ